MNIKQELFVDRRNIEWEGQKDMVMGEVNMIEVLYKHI
jgi:hypothetical protein